MGTEPPSGIVLRAQPHELLKLAVWTQSLAARYTLGSTLTAHIDLCLTETVTNVVDHGYAGQPAGRVRVNFRDQPDRVVFQIEDEGVPFDPTSYVPPELPRSLSDATIGGRGIRLVRRYANEIQYRRDAGINRLTLTFLRVSSEAHLRPMDTCTRE